MPVETALENLRQQLRLTSHADEGDCVEALLRTAPLLASQRDAIQTAATHLIQRCREHRQQQPLLDAFLQEFGLNNQEGLALMALAEALLRIPDTFTAEALIDEKLTAGDWEAHRGHSDSWLVNASTLGLIASGKFAHLTDPQTREHLPLARRLLGKLGEPLMLAAMRRAMGYLGNQYVLGRNLPEALVRSRHEYPPQTRFSFDMLGEGARTQSQADGYYQAYRDALLSLGHSPATPPLSNSGLHLGNSISIKLSALHPRYRYSHRPQLLRELLPRLNELARVAQSLNIGISIDAEEASRLDLSLDLFSSLRRDPQLEGWHGLGLVVQAYQKRASLLIDWLATLAAASGHQIPVRLVKGAYWDTEIKLAQQQGYTDYPVFTRKPHTDLSYQVCAQKLLAAGERLFPQFATHNAYTISMILTLAGDQPFELQRLHGMGEVIYRELIDTHPGTLPMRVYAPVGEHRDLLPYLVRRLLENSANSSFVHRFLDPRIDIRQLVADPQERTASSPYRRHPDIPAPPHIYRQPPAHHAKAQPRLNARGLDLDNPLSAAALLNQLQAPLAIHQPPETESPPVLARRYPVLNPSTEALIGYTVTTPPAQIGSAFSLAANAQRDWDAMGGKARAQCLERMAELLEEHLPELVQWIVSEAGRTLTDSVAEVREAIDFCRYYAMQGRRQFGSSQVMPGPTGEINQLSLHGCGVFLCISPWNFPLAIFCGQIAAALMAGNGVIAKPAEQTPLTARRCIDLFHQAGVPPDLLHLVYGAGAVTGAACLQQPQLAGVAFTGSTATAKFIQRALAEREGPILPLIAETGGINAMLADSTTLLEQLLDDVLLSAFGSAGQRCSALRLLCIQEDIAAPFLQLLQEAIGELSLGDPGHLATDMGPVIDCRARDQLFDYIAAAKASGRLLVEYPPEQIPAGGWFVPPAVIRLDRISDLQREIFGPVLHWLTYPAGTEASLVEAINSQGFGLTFGIHSRLQHKYAALARQSHAGNVYINRSLTGAVVGVQPFGGHGLSGTGPKAGGPHYLYRFAREQTLTINTMATGGNTELLTLNGDGE